MKYETYILISKEDDKVWESTSLNWALVGDDDNIQSVHNEIDIGLTLLLNHQETFHRFGPVKLILGDSETNYFRVILFQTIDMKTYRLLCKK